MVNWCHRLLFPELIFISKNDSELFSSIADVHFMLLCCLLKYFWISQYDSLIEKVKMCHRRIIHKQLAWNAVDSFPTKYFQNGKLANAGPKGEPITTP